MKYYLANLGVHALVSLVLVLLIVIFTNRNKKRKTKHVIAYFFPFILAALAIFHMARYTAPRLLDLTDVYKQNYFSYTGTLEEVSSLGNYIVVDGVKYYVNPIHKAPEVGTLIKVKYTNYGHYAVEVSQSETPVVEQEVGQVVDN